MITVNIYKSEENIDSNGKQITTGCGAITEKDFKSTCGVVPDEKPSTFADSTVLVSSHASKPGNDIPV